MTSWIFRMENSIFGYEIIRVYGVDDFKTAREMAKESFMSDGPGVIEWKTERIKSLYDEELNNERKCRIEDGTVSHRK